MSTKNKRQAELLTALRSVSEPVAGARLAGRLGISARSLRNYVAELNRGRTRPLIQSSQAGYALDPGEYARYRAAQARVRPTGDEPLSRVREIARRLAHADGLDVFELASELSISDATLEADLVQVRAYLREQGVTLTRDKNQIFLQATERLRRRLIRQLILHPHGLDVAGGGQMLTPEAGRLKGPVQRALQQHSLSINDYVMPGVLTHLHVAVERIRQGHLNEEPLPDRGSDPVLTAAVHSVVGAVRSVTSITLGANDQRVLYDVLSANTDRSLSQPDREHLANPQVVEMVRTTIREISDYYGVDLSEGVTSTTLTLHIDNLLKRAASGDSQLSPLGSRLRHTHPLIHELALFFGRRIEEAFQVRIASGEIDFIALHLGVRFQEYLESGRRPTITVVTPRHRDNAQELVSRLASHLKPDAIIERLVTDPTADLTGITSDLVVSTVDLAQDLPAEVVPISPFLSHDDIDRVRSACKVERRRRRRALVRSNLMAMLDPGLFLHQHDMGSSEEAIRIGTALLQDRGMVDEDFVEDVLDRERRAPTSFNNAFAIPHSLFMDAHQTGIAIITTDESIPWGDSSVRLVILFAVSPEGRSLFRDLLDALIEVLDDPQSVAALTAAGTSFDSFRGTLSGLLA